MHRGADRGAHEIVSSFYLGLEHRERGARHGVRRAQPRPARRDHGQEVPFVPRTPVSNTQVRWRSLHLGGCIVGCLGGVSGLVEQHGDRVLAEAPHVPRHEELVQQRRWRRVRVQLAHPRRQQCPPDSTREAARMLVDAAPLRPELDRTQRGLEARHVRHAAQDRRRHARAVERVHVLVLDALRKQAGRVGRQDAAIRPRQLRQLEPCEQQVDGHAAQRKLDHRHERIGHRMDRAWLDAVRSLQPTDESLASIKKVGALHKVRHDGDEVNVRASAGYAEGTRSEREHDAAGVARLLLAQPVRDADRTHPLTQQLLHLCTSSTARAHERRMASAMAEERGLERDRTPQVLGRRVRFRH